MCYDISFSTTIEMVTSYIPDLIVDPQLGIDYEMRLHAQAQSFRKYPVILDRDGQKHLTPLEWGIVTEYMDTPEKLKMLRKSHCNARSEKILGEKKYARSWATRVLIVLTDGIHNTGTDPIYAASQAASENILIYTVTFSTEADIAKMQTVAEIASGKHFHAKNGSELAEAFREIAQSLPTLVTF